MKRCNKCMELLPETHYHKYNESKDGLQHYCKECQEDYNREYRKNNKEMIQKRSKIYYNNNKEKLIEKNRKYKKDKREELKAYYKQYYENNKEKIITKKIQYYNENKEKILEHKKIYREDNREKIRKIDKKSYEKNKSKRLKQDGEYAKKYPEKRREITRRRRLKKQQLFEDFTMEEWQQKVDTTDGICPICHTQYIERHGITIDHNPPISKAPIGYYYTINDVNPICLSCNSSKGNKI